MSSRKEQPAHLRAVAEARTSPSAIAARLVQLRTARDLSQAGLAKLAGVSQQSIAAIETLRVDTPRYLPILSDALGVHPEYLRTGRNPGVPLYTATELSARSSYPKSDTELSIDQPMLVPHDKKYSARTFSLVVPDDACAASCAARGTLVVVDPEVGPQAGDLICVHFRTGPTLRRFQDSTVQCFYAPDDPLYTMLDASTARLIGTVIEWRRLRP